MRTDANWVTYMKNDNHLKKNHNYFVQTQKHKLRRMETNQQKSSNATKITFAPKQNVHFRLIPWSAV